MKFYFKFGKKMSRIGKKPILIPQGVKVELKDEQIKVSGPKGSLELKLRPEVKVEVKEDQLVVCLKNKSNNSRPLHGLTRALIANMIEGVTNGFCRVLKLVGTGYRAKLEGENLVLSLGFSHPVMIKPLLGINFEVEGNDTIKIMGIDKQQVGEQSAVIRQICPPESYKGKGIRYLEEQVRRKPGKAGKVGAAGTGGGK